MKKKFFICSSRGSFTEIGESHPNTGQQDLISTHAQLFVAFIGSRELFQFKDDLEKVFEVSQEVNSVLGERSGYNSANVFGAEGSQEQSETLK